MAKPTDEKKLEVLLGAALDAEHALDADPVDGDEEVRDHVDCLSCSETLSDALANARAAIAACGKRRDLRDARKVLQEALAEIGEESSR